MNLPKITQAHLKCIFKLIGYPKFFVIVEVLDTMVSDRCTIVLSVQVVVPFVAEKQLVVVDPDVRLRVLDCSFGSCIFYKR